MENMLYPIGIQSFSEIREKGFVYVDKTAAIYKMTSSGKFYFLSRPRRFGKSLLVSTLEAYFKGRKELFKGLAIEKLEKEWEKYPVLHLDFTGSRYMELSDLQTALDQQLSRWESIYGIASKYADPSARFKDVIDAACHKTGKQVVVLIDEYEKPIIDNIDNNELMEQFRRELQGFYSVLKGKDDSIRLAFLTGVTKLSKMSIFSGLNNLEDISMSPDYSSICGITSEEIKSYFKESVEDLAKFNHLSVADCYTKLARLYDGYHFSIESEGVYNPFSLLNAFKSRLFKLYWFGTGTPTVLVRYLKKEQTDLENISRENVREETLTDANFDNLKPVTLMYQTGYLTIKDYNPEQFTYNLDYPNEEVKRGFVNSLSETFTPSLSDDKFSIFAFANDVKAGNVEAFMRRFSAFLSDNGYRVQGEQEKYFQNTMSIFFRLMGLYVKTEYQTSNGRIDIVVETDRFVYIIELKRDQSPDVALRQIDEKGYDKPFLASGKTIVKLGINFSSQTRTVDGWKRA
jgi:hypothetical protein